MTTPTPASLASSVQGLALRVTALTASGTAVTGSTSAYTMNRFVTAQFTPQYAGSNNIRQQLANGNFAVTFQTSDVFMNVNVSLHIAGPDPQFNQIAVGGTILTDDDDTVVGWKPTPAGDIDQPNGVALELWSYAISGSRPATDYPYYHWVLPRVFLHPSDNMVVENNVMAWNATGWGNDNPNFAGTGVGKASEVANGWAFATDRPYQYARVKHAPINVNGYEVV
jgi:hypothetical protein